MSTRRERRRGRAESLRLVAAGVVGLFVFVVAWEALVRILDVRPFVLRAPSKIVPELFDDATVLPRAHARRPDDTRSSGS